MCLWEVTVFCSQKEITLHFTKINPSFGFPLFSKGFTSQNFAFLKIVLLEKIKKQTLFLSRSFIHRIEDLCEYMAAKRSEIWIIITDISSAIDLQKCRLYRCSQFLDWHLVKLLKSSSEIRVCTFFVCGDDLWDSRS